MTGHNTGAVLEGKITKRGSSNSNQRGGSPTRRRRKEWLLETWASNVKLVRIEWSWGSVTYEAYVVDVETLRTYESVRSAEEVATCRCFRCGTLLHFGTITVDRIQPGGSYARTNIRPACGLCNSSTGGALGAARRAAKRVVKK